MTTYNLRAENIHRIAGSGKGTFRAAARRFATGDRVMLQGPHARPCLEVQVVSVRVATGSEDEITVEVCSPERLIGRYDTMGGGGVPGADLKFRQ